jgi:hypothetical protein
MIDNSPSVNQWEMEVKRQHTVAIKGLFMVRADDSKYITLTRADN